VRILAGLQAGATALAFSPDGQSLAAGSDDGTISIWDIGSARSQATLSGHSAPVYCLDWSHGGGTVLASGGGDCTVRLWSAPLCSESMLAAVPEVRERHAKEVPYQPLRSYHTRATPVCGLKFSRRNLLLGAGAYVFQRGS
jgi:transcription initiation factor TFIID subunit 5